jgi:hypothetical protein
MHAADISRQWPVSHIVLGSYWTRTGERPLTAVHSKMNVIRNRIWHVMELKRAVMWLWTAHVTCLALILVYVYFRSIRILNRAQETRLVQIVFFCVATPCSLVNGYQRFQTCMRAQRATIWTITSMEASKFTDFFSVLSLRSTIEDGNSMLPKYVR